MDKEKERYLKSLCNRLITYMRKNLPYLTICIIEDDDKVEYDLIIYNNSGSLLKNPVYETRSLYKDIFPDLIKCVIQNPITNGFIKEDISLEEIDLQLSIRGF